MKNIKYIFLIVFVFAASAFMKFGIHSSRIGKTEQEASRSQTVQLQDSNFIFEEKKTEQKMEMLEPAPRAVINFKNELDSILKSLPTRTGIRKEARLDVHSTPEIIFRAAKKIGQVTDLMSQSPELKPSALRFYSECATQEDGIPAIRAVCLSRARELSQELGVAELKLSVPRDVEDLARL